MRLFDAGSRAGGPGQVHDRVLTVPNAITAVRLLGLPVFVWLIVSRGAYGPAFVVLTVIAATDWIDGYVARRFDQVSRLGKIMDPLVDRALLATAAITLVVERILPWPIAALIVGRDALLLIGGALLFRGLPPIPVSRLGKLATALLLVGVPAFLLAQMESPVSAALEIFAWALTVAGIAVYYLAAALYLAVARAALGAGRFSADGRSSGRQRPGTGKAGSG
ncbi:MAG TPA: CDP-alcohol phosphatidyltransferase family protein [Egibacteraceae bacterium]|nr:CDP-alcohol phosphatidyltransferase family protein [Egibacteraceae bacterium]